MNWNKKLSLTKSISKAQWLRMGIIWGFVVTLNLLLSNCDKKADEISQVKIRGALKLSMNDIPALDGATVVKSGEWPLYFELGGQGDRFDIVQYVYTWTSSVYDVVYLEMAITESDEQALRYITDKRAIGTFPPYVFLHRQLPEDHPTIAGEKSFGQGSYFIRNNIVIDISTSGIFSERNEELAQQIDKIISDGPCFNSLIKIKPVIKDFRILNNPVVEQSKTLINIDVADPNNKEIYYKWISTRIIGPGGTVIEENGNYYFEANSTYTYDETNVQELMAIAINEFGFFTDSTITITTLKE